MEPGASDPAVGLSGRAPAVVVGAGPAGLAVAAALAGRGLDVVVVDPEPERSWPQTYGAWVDELPEADARWFAHRWDDVRVVVDGGERRLPRPYALLNNVEIRAALRDRLTAAGGRLLRGRAVGVRPAGAVRQVSVVTGGRSSTLSAAVVVDASGHRPALLRVPRAPAPPLQTAVGWFGTFPTPPAASGAMTFMDWTTPDGAAASPATFLYAMDLGGGRWLAEETSLAASPPVGDDVLAARLAARLDARTAPPSCVERVEHVRFPMGSPLPDRAQPVVGFGAAAGFVHPATGFSVARSLRRAGDLADAVADSVAAGDAADRTAEAAWAAVWTRDDLVQRRLFELGLASLLRLDAQGLAAFFGAFFELPTERWSRYLSADGRTADLLVAMGRVFLAVPGPVRTELARAALAMAAPRRSAGGPR